MRKGLGLLCFLFLLSPLVSPRTSSTNPAQLALTHVTVIDATGGSVQPDVTVVIRGDRIAAMGKSGKIPVPAGSQVVNAAGKFLIPGLWDMHFHWYEKEYLPLTIANGVTGVRVMLGYAEHYEWRKEIEAGQLLGPRMVIATRTVDGPRALFPWSIAVANETEARQAIIKAQEYGADFVKVVDDIPREAFFALAKEASKRGIPFAGHVPVSVSVEEASNAGERSIEHLTRILDACSSREADLLKSWQEEILAGVTDANLPISAIAEGPGYRPRMQLALETFDQRKAQELFALLRTNHTWQCPTLSALRRDVFFEDPSFAADPLLKYISARTKSGWLGTNDARSKTRSAEDTAVLKRAYHKDLEIVGAMRRAGVEFLAGTDADNPYCFPGFSLHEELTLLVQAGLTPMEALQAATLNPARFLGREQESGTVAPGKLADLVLLDANPLDDIGNTRKIAAVVYGGKLLSRAALDAVLAKIASLASRKSIADVIAPTLKERGVEAAIRQYRELKSTQLDSFDFGQYELSGLGGQLLEAKKFKDAIRIFELNTRAYPRWWWAYDDLGQAYMESGDKDLAIKNYKKSLQLDPGNQNAVVKLKQLGSQ